MREITSKPDWGVNLIAEDGSAGDVFQHFLDDLEGALNTYFLGAQVDLPSYTVATLPSAARAAGLIFVSNETGGAVPAFSDGTNWRRMTDRAIVS